MNLYNLSKYFLKFSALEWQENTHWVPEKFKQHKAFQNYPFKNALKIFKKFGLNDFRVEVDISNAVEDQKKHVLNNKLLPQIYKKITNVDEGLRILYVGRRFMHDENILKSIELNREYIDAIRELFDEILENNESNILNKNYDIKGFKFQKGQSIFRIYVSLQKKLIEDESERDYFGFYVDDIYRYELTNKDLEFIKTLNAKMKTKILLYMKGMDKDKYNQISNYLNKSI